MYCNKSDRDIGKERIWDIYYSSVFRYFVNMKGIRKFNVFNYNLYII